MANFYVSQQHGSNSYDGQAPVYNGTHGPKLTLTGSNSLVTVLVNAGDIGYVGPGLYRESYSFQANNQTLQADPLCLSLTGDTPGDVRISGTTAGNVPQTSPQALNGNGYTGCIAQG